MYETQDKDKEKQNKEYSFIEAFKTYSILKKFIVIVFLPFIPIYSISKYFQVRANKKDKHPHIAINMVIISVIYFFTIYPMALSLTWLIFQILLFPLSFVVAYYLHRIILKETHEEVYEDDGSNPFLFEVHGFKKEGRPFAFVIVIALLGSFFGFMFILGFIALILILFPGIYKKLAFVPKRLLLLSSSIFGFLSYIPAVNLKGRWFIEQGSERKRLETIPDIVKFIFSNWQPFFLINVGITTLVARAILFTRGDPPVGTLLSLDVLTSTGFFFMFAIIPFFMGFYFIWVWVWQDAELKVALTRKSTKGVDQFGMRIEETAQLLPAADSIKALFILFFGLPAIVWFVDESSRRDSDFASGTTGLLALSIAFILAMGGIVILMGIMYYRSGAHEYLVNELRDHIKKNYMNEPDNGVAICYSSVQPVPLKVLKEQESKFSN